MDVKRALRTAKCWLRGDSVRALSEFVSEQMVIDEVHRFRLICEIACEREWLRVKLNGAESRMDGDTEYSMKDHADFDNLLDVIVTVELGEDLNGYS